MTRRLPEGLRSFRVRLVLAVILFMLPSVMLPTLITSRLYMQTLQDQNEQITINSFINAQAQIESMLRYASTASYVLRYNEAVTSYLFFQEGSALDLVLAKKDFIAAVENTYQNNDFMDSVIFFTPQGEMAGSSRKWRYFDVAEHPILRTQAFTDALDSSGFTWIGAYGRSYFTRYDYYADSDVLVCGVRRLDDLIVLIGLSEQSLRECFSYIVDEESYACLLDGQGRQIAGADASLYGRAPDFYAAIDESRFSSALYQDAQGVTHQVVHYRLDEVDWTLAKTTPISLYRDNTLPLQRTALAVGSATLLAVSILFTAWARRFFAPLQGITGALEQVKNGDLDVRIAENRRDLREIELMKQQFNQMLESIHTLLANNERSEREKMHLEIRSLQAQITPHFLYNTIASIRWLATLSGADNVADMLVALIALLRPVFSEWTLDWTLREELDYLDHYLQLMRLRHGNMVDIAIDRGGVDGTARLPRFILQPLVENCVKHNPPAAQALHITVTLAYAGQDIVVRVTDNGAGIAPEQLARIRAALEGGEAGVGAQESIGLVNVSRRLRLFFGPGYGIDIESAPGEGTAISVRILR